MADRLIEMNNNRVDVVQLLHLKTVESSDQLSHASSLESLDPHQGSHRSASPSGCSGTTSCSESSFEMASTSSDSFDEPSTTSGLRPSASGIGPPPPTSFSMDSFPAYLSSLPSFAVRERIEKELSELDTGLPQLDFVRLEETLTEAAKENEQNERKRLGEEVRRRLAMVDSFAEPTPVVTKRPLKSNLGQRIQAAMNLQVCYMNELSEEGESSSDDEEPRVPKSKSVPDFNRATNTRTKNLRAAALAGKKLSPEDRETVLRAETLHVRELANGEGRKAVADMKRSKGKNPRRTLSRQTLSGMRLDQLRAIHEHVDESIDATNAQLVSLLLARDSLHMERDSLQVDIDDLVCGYRASLLHLPTLLHLQDNTDTSNTPPA